MSLLSERVQLLTETSTPDVFPSEFTNNIYLSKVHHNKELENYSYESTFSLKMCLSGYEAYYVNDSYKKLKEGSCLFVNQGDEIRTTKVDGEGMSIFFESKLVQEALNGLNLSPEEMLVPERDYNSIRALSNESLPGCANTLRFLNSISHKVKSNAHTTFLLDNYHELLHNIFLDFGLIRKQLNKLVEVKKLSTRTELFRRLEVARGFIHDHSNRPISLHQISEVAHLSSYHLTRLFKSLYGLSPVRYHMLLRIAKAKELLATQQDISISEVSRRLNYSQVTYFSQQFKSVTGYSPRSYRLLKR